MEQRGLAVSTHVNFSIGLEFRALSKVGNNECTSVI